MGLHAGQGRHRLAVDIQRRVALRDETACHRAGSGVADAQDVLAHRHRIGRGHLLLHLAEEVVDEVQMPIGDEQRVPAVPGALFEQHAVNVGALYGDLGQHREGSARDVHARPQWNRGGVRIVDVAGAIAGQ